MRVVAQIILAKPDPATNSTEGPRFVIDTDPAVDGEREFASHVAQALENPDYGHVVVTRES